MNSVASSTILVDTIVAFLRSVGIEVVEGIVPDTTFLPGVHVSSGTLVFERSKLRWPGDLFHEAGHIAVTPAAQRHTLRDDLSGREDPSADGEVEAIAWSYAAISSMGLDPGLVFHPGGYRGKAEALLQTYSLGVYPGVGGLEAFGMALGHAAAKARGVSAYPKMLCWLRP